MKAFEDLKESAKKDIIIDGLMRSKGVYLLVSKPKVGKSLFALQLANSIANGKPFLGHEILKPSPVLYITTELSDSQLKDRCNLLGISFKKNTFFAIDRSDKQSINFRDIEYEIKEGSISASKLSFTTKSTEYKDGYRLAKAGDKSATLIIKYNK